MDIADNGIVCNEEKHVLENSRLDFKKLYNRGDNSDFDDIHYNRAKIHKHLIEMNMQDPLYITNAQLNAP